jgi:hypothetical protein
MVKGLHISLNSPQYDCVACVQVKQHVTLLSPFPKASVETQTQTKQGELTHTDLWDKYPVQSLNKNQYFHSFLEILHNVLASLF